MKKVKAFFSFTRKEQIGIIFLITLIFCTILINFFIKEQPPKAVDEATLIAWEKDVAAFYEAQEKAFQQKDSLKIAKEQQRESKWINPYQKEASVAFQAKQRPDPFSFDPNTASEEEFTNLGFSKKQATAIINYRSDKGNVFKEKKDFQKVFVVSDEMYTRLKPWILLPDEITSSPEIIPAAAQAPAFILELNCADTTDLKKIKGIGSVLAKRIVAYREKLGGYYSVNQLLDINGIDQERFTSIEPCLIVDATYLKKFDLNTTAFKNFIQHPYFEHYIVKALFEYKDKKGKLSSIEEIKEIPLIYDELYNKISPYLYASSYQ